MNYELHVNNMKRFYLVLAVALLSLLSVNAQTNQVVWVNGRAVMGQSIGQVDSIKYGTMEEADRLYLTLPRKVVIHDTIIETTVVRDTFHIPADAIAGVFSVSEDKKVCFAKGNLQYTQTTKTWSFAEHQYDMIGEANMNGSELADKIDWFGWSSTGTAKWGISISTDNSDYRGDFVDWGTNVVNGNAANVWRVLSQDEWLYLFQHNRWTLSKVNGTLGFMLLPANFVAPAGLTVSVLGDGNLSDTYKNFSESDYSSNVYTESQFSQLESAGAVFLPCAGFRYGSSVSGVGSDGIYWSATPNDMGYARGINFYSTYAGTHNGWARLYGQSVRLVHELK